MNPEPTPTPREQIEMRLTALLMGELSTEETVALHALLAADPELAKLHARLRQAMELLREATAEPEPATPTPARLSSERRERLLAHFQGSAPQPAPIVKVTRRDWSWVLPLGVAASVVFLLAGLALPSFSRARRSGNFAGTFAKSAKDAVMGEMHETDEKSGWEDGRTRGEGEASKPGADYSSAKALTKSGTAVWDLAPAKKSGASALYLPPTDDAPASGEPASPLPGLGGTVDSSGGGGGSGGLVADGKLSGSGAIWKGSGVAFFDDSNRLVARDGVQANGGQISAASSQPAPPSTPTPTSAAEPAAPMLGDIPLLGTLFSSTEKRSSPDPGGRNDGRAAQEREADEGIVKSGAGTTTLSGLNTYNGLTSTSAGALALKGLENAKRGASSGALNGDLGLADTGGDDGKKSNRLAPFPVTPTTPTTFESGLAGGSLELDAVPPVTKFDGTINYGAPIQKPAAPTGSDLLSDASGVVTTRSGERAQIEVVREFRYLGEGQTGKDARNLRGLPGLAAGENKPAEIAAKDVEIRQNNPAELYFDNLRGGEATKADPKTATDGTHWDETDRRRSVNKEEGEKVNLPKATKVPQATGPQVSHGLAKLEVRDAEPLDQPDAPRSVQPVPEPARPAAKPLSPPPPPSSGPAPVVTAPDTAEHRKELALRERQAGDLYKTIDEAKKLDGNGREGKEQQAGNGQLGFGLALDALKDPTEKNVEDTTKGKNAKREREKLAPEQLARLDKMAEQPAKPAEGQKLKEVDEELPAARPAQPAAIPQPEVATSANAFSTFSLNVSDVSFKLAGASLEKGRMPELATVRSEEFINAFDYRDPEPAAGAPVAFATERARYPFAQNRDLVRFSVKTAAAGRQPGRPLNLVLLLDNSGSMERADRVRILREALRVLAAQLQPQDRLSVVTFARTPRLWADGVTGDKAGDAVARVGEITPQGGTNLEAALDLGYATALKHYQPGGISRVILLTDGAANLGDVNPDALKRKVETNRQRGVALDCFGIGWEGYDDTVLETLARNGDGRYGFINTPEEAASGFAAQLAGALRVAASDVKVQVEWNPRRVTAYRQIGYAKHQLKKEQFRDNTVDAAEIGAAESGNALYVVEVNPRGEGDLATVRVRFKVPGTSDYKEHEWPVPFTPNASSLEQASPALRLAGTASAFSEWLVASPYAAEVTPDRLLGLLNGVPAIYPADPRPKKLEWMIRTAKSVSGR